MKRLPTIRRVDEQTAEMQEDVPPITMARSASELGLLRTSSSLEDQPAMRDAHH